MASIIITEDIPDALETLGRNHEVELCPLLWRDESLLIDKIQNSRGIVVRNQTNVTQFVIENAPQLEVIGRAGAGLNNIDCRAAEDHGVVVTYTPAENSVSVAELVLGTMLSMARDIPAADIDTKQGGWDRSRFTGTELFEKTLGIVGFGRIGRLVAERALAFGMSIVAHDEFVTPDAPDLRRLNTTMVSLAELFAQSDFVSLHVPLTEETWQFVGPGELAQMRRSAVLINASRGEVVNESALIDALSSRSIRGAALDVRATEPPTLGQLEKLDNVLLTPHIGAFTVEAQRRVISTVCKDVAAVLRGERSPNAVGIDRFTGRRS